jgi:hypothetical protein
LSVGYGQDFCWYMAVRDKQMRFFLATLGISPRGHAAWRMVVS